MLAARNVKSTGSAGLIIVKVAVTGLNVPGVNAGMVTIALVALTTVKDCKPVPALTWSTVTEPGPLVTPKEARPPGKRSPSLTVVIGVQTCGVGVGVGVGGGGGGAVQLVMLFVSNVTAPLSAMALPLRFAPVVTVILVSAMMFPWNCVPVPSRRTANLIKHIASSCPIDQVNF